MSDQSQVSEMLGIRVNEKEVRALAASQAEGFWRAQAHLLDIFEQLTQDMIARRREATDAALQFGRRLSACQDANELNSACGDWVAGSVERVIADSRALNDHAMRLFQEAIGMMPGVTGVAGERTAEKPAETRPARGEEAAPAKKSAAGDLRRTG